MIWAENSVWGKKWMIERVPFEIGQVVKVSPARDI